MSAASETPSIQKLETFDFGRDHFVKFGPGVEEHHHLPYVLVEGPDNGQNTAMLMYLVRTYGHLFSRRIIITHGTTVWQDKKMDKLWGCEIVEDRETHVQDVLKSLQSTQPAHDDDGHGQTQVAHANKTLLLVFDSRVFKTSSIVRNSRVKRLVAWGRNMHTAVLGAIVKYTDLSPAMRDPDIHLISAQSNRLRIENYPFGAFVSKATKMQALQIAGNAPHYLIATRDVDRIFKFTVPSRNITRIERPSDASKDAVSHINHLEREELLDDVAREKQWRKRVLREMCPPAYSFEDFCATVDSCTKPYGSLVWNPTNTAAAEALEKKVFWYRAEASSVDTNGISLHDATQNDDEWDMLEDVVVADKQCTQVVPAFEHKQIQHASSSASMGTHIALATSVEEETLYLLAQSVLIVLGLRRMAKTSFALSLAKTRGTPCLFISASGVPTEVYADTIAMYGLGSNVSVRRTFPSKEELDRISPNTVVIVENTYLHDNLEHIRKLRTCANVAQIIYCTEKLDALCFSAFADEKNSITVIASGWRRTLKCALYTMKEDSVEYSPLYTDVKTANAGMTNYAAFPMLLLQATCVVNEQTVHQVMYTNMKWTLGLRRRDSNDPSIPFYQVASIATAKSVSEERSESTCKSEAQ